MHEHHVFVKLSDQGLIQFLWLSKWRTCGAYSGRKPFMLTKNFKEAQARFELNTGADMKVHKFTYEIEPD